MPSSFLLEFDVSKAPFGASQGTQDINAYSVLELDINLEITGKLPWVSININWLFFFPYSPSSLA